MMSSSPEPRSPVARSPQGPGRSRGGRALALASLAALFGVLVLKSGVACASTTPLRAGDTYLPDAGMAGNNLPPPNPDPPRRVDIDAGPVTGDDVGSEP